MTIQGDLPDWQTETTPDVQSVSFNSVAPGAISTLFSSASPWRIWGAWINVLIASNSSFAGGAAFWGAQIGDGGGNSLIRAACYAISTNQVGSQGISLAIPGYTPKVSGGFYTVNLITDASIGNLNGRANGGILYSQP